MPRNTAKQQQDVPDLLLAQYQQRVQNKLIQYSAKQVAALQIFQQLLERVMENSAYQSKPAWQKCFSPPRATAKNLYIYGDVGCGKSMLMDLFYEACPLTRKRRVHFHAFMLEVHAFTHEWRKQNTGSAIPALAKKIRATTLLLCLDEFHVVDIVDAMILSQLFKALFHSGIILVATSNLSPDDLYQGGLQRALFLPFIKLLKDSADVLKLYTGQDYRLTKVQLLSATYFHPLGEAAAAFILDSYNTLTNHAPAQAGCMQVMGRTVTLSAVHGDVCMVDFAELCDAPLGAVDYLELAGEFGTLLIAGIPRMSQECRDAARRFVTLVDALYEHKVKLICTAEVAVELLYTQGNEAFEFKRTQSRLIEMQSQAYWHAAHAAI